MPTSTLNQKEAFLRYLQVMNVDMLDLVLNDTCTYFGAPKEVFFERLSYISNQYKLSGCKESFKIKQYKSHKNYYALMLPFLSLCNKFIIEEKANKIVRIYNDKIVKTKEDLECLSQFDFFFGDDEKVDFRPTTDYIMALHDSTNAYEELNNDKFTTLTSKDMHKWLDKHASLYEYVSINFLFFKLNNFRHLYFAIKFTSQQIQYYNIVDEALKSYPAIHYLSSVKEWLDKYFDLYYYKTQYFSDFISEIDVYNKTIKYEPRYNIYLKGDDFLSVFLFNELFQRQRDIMKKKYK